MMEMCKKLETYHPQGEGMDPKCHGYEGPVNVSDGGYRGKSGDAFMETVKKMGYKEIVDLQDGTACGGFGVSFYPGFLLHVVVFGLPLFGLLTP